MSYLPFILAVSVCAVISDFISGRIPNCLVGSAVFCAAAYRILELHALLRSGICPLPMICNALGGFFVPFLLLGIPAFLKMIGGGDVKLFAAFGIYLGFSAILKLILYALFAGAIMSALIILGNRSLVSRFAYFFRYLGHSLQSRRLLFYRQDSSDEDRNRELSGAWWISAGKGNGEFPFSLAIFAGLLFYFFH